MRAWKAADAVGSDVFGEVEAFGENFAERNVEEITEGLDDVERELALNIACIESVDRQKAECIIKHCAADDTPEDCALDLFL